MSDCLFCRIIAGAIPARIVFEDRDAIAFEDINPQAPVHVLVVPRKHIATTLAMTDEDRTLIGRLFQIANEIAAQKGVAERGFRLVMNTNPEAGQTVYHIHLHVLAGRHMQWPPG